MTTPDSTGPRHATSPVRHEDERPVVITERDYDPATTDQEGRAESVHRDSDRGNLVEEHRIKRAKTSAVAVFSLIFGLTALYAVLTVILSPLGLVLSLIGLVLGFLGIRAARTMGVTGKGVAISGIVLSVIALVGSIAIAAGVTFFLNDEDAVQRFENSVEDLRDDLPQDIDIQP